MDLSFNYYYCYKWHEILAHTQKELMMIRRTLTHQQQQQQRTKIMENIWGNDRDQSENFVFVFVSFCFVCFISYFWFESKRRTITVNKMNFFSAKTARIFFLVESKQQTLILVLTMGSLATYGSIEVRENFEFFCFVLCFFTWVIFNDDKLKKTIKELKILTFRPWKKT